MTSGGGYHFQWEAEWLSRLRPPLAASVLVTLNITLVDMLEETEMQPAADHELGLSVSTAKKYLEEREIDSKGILDDVFTSYFTSSGH